MEPIHTSIMLRILAMCVLLLLGLFYLWGASEQIGGSFTWSPVLFGLAFIVAGLRVGYNAIRMIDWVMDREEYWQEPK